MNILGYIQSKHNLIFKLLIVVSCSVFITALLPNKQVKGHSVGSFDAIWSSPDLIADQDFFLKKSQEEIDYEKKIIENESKLIVIVIASLVVIKIIVRIEGVISSSKATGSVSL